MSQQALDAFRKRHPEYSKDVISDEELAQKLIKKYPMFDKAIGDIAAREPGRPARDLLDPAVDESEMTPAAGGGVPTARGAASPAPGVPGEPAPPGPDPEKVALGTEAERRPPSDTPPPPVGPPGGAPGGGPAAPGGGPSGALPPLPLPAAGVMPAPGVLDAPRDVAMDAQGRVLTDPFTKNATATAALKTAVGMGLPMAGQYAGGVIGGVGGGLVGGPVGAAAGTLIGQSVGGMAGEGIAQYTGLSPESKPQIALAGATPFAGPLVQAVRHPKETASAVANVAKNVYTRTGGWNKAQETAATAIRDLPDTLRTGGDYKALYKEADRRIAMNPARINTANTQQMIKNIRGQIPADPTDPKLQQLLTIMDTLDTAVMKKTPQGALASVKQLRQQMRDIRHLMKEPEANAIWGAMVQDLEAAAATSPAASALRAAANALKGDMAARRFTAIVNGAIAEKEGLTSINAPKIIRALDNDPNMSRWLSQAEIQRLQAEVAKRAKMPGPRIKYTMPTDVKGLARTGVGWLLGGPGGAAVGATLPVLGAIGRHTLDEVRDVALNPTVTQVASVILQGARAGWAEEGEE
jgi:hypothetical protein